MCLDADIAGSSDNRERTGRNGHAACLMECSNGMLEGTATTAASGASVYKELSQAAHMHCLPATQILQQALLTSIPSIAVARNLRTFHCAVASLCSRVASRISSTPGMPSCDARRHGKSEDRTPHACTRGVNPKQHPQLHRMQG